MSDHRHRDAEAWRDVDAWLVWLELQGKAPGTLYVYERQTAPLLRRCPELRADEITADEINACLSLVPPRSRHITRSIYNCLFEWLEGDERISRSPMRGHKVPKMRAGKRRPRDIFSEEERGLLVNLPSPHGSLFEILFFTGLRRSEARNLRRSHVDLGRMRLMVYGGKGDKDRMIPLTPETCAAIADLDLFERLQPSDHFWGLKRYEPGDPRKRRDPISTTGFHRWYQDCIEAAGVRYLNPHQTRHTYHYWLRYDLKLELEERQELMGHESPETTVRQYGRNEFEQIAAKVSGVR